VKPWPSRTRRTILERSIGCPDHARRDPEIGKGPDRYLVFERRQVRPGGHVGRDGFARARQPCHHGRDHRQRDFDPLAKASIQITNSLQPSRIRR
jgi:hypothetical protein